jgi:hypothetical protein
MDDDTLLDHTIYLLAVLSEYHRNIMVVIKLLLGAQEIQFRPIIHQKNKRIVDSLGKGV